MSEMNLQGIITDAFTQYAGAVIQSRALTDVRDCIKPSARQIYYSLFTDKFVHEKPFNKTLKAIGSAMRFYIHGDASCEGIIMRSGQPFSMRYPLVEVEGSYGNLMETGNWAASRYTSSRLSALANYLIQDTDIHTIDEWVDNYDDTEQYPRVMSSLGYYNIVNGSMGIAVGLASNIPQFNLTEVNNALITLLENPDCEFEDILCYPDFATGATLINKQEVAESLRKGQGDSCILQATFDFDEKNNALIVTELPYGVYTNTICKEIEKLVAENPDLGIISINDLTGENVCLKIYLSKKANVENIKQILYANTSLQKTYGINMTMLEDGRFPKVFGWREALSAHLAHEKEVYINLYTYNLEKLQARLNIVNGIILAISNIDKTIQIIKESKSTANASQSLQTEYRIDEEQTKAILDIKLSRLARLESKKLEDEKENLLASIQEIEAILGSEELLKQEMIKKFQEVIDKFGDARRTQIIQKEIVKTTNAGKAKVEEAPQDIVVTLNNDGYVKAVPVAQYKKDKNALVEFKTTTKDLILLFSSLGKCYRISSKDIGLTSSKDKGKALGAILKMESGEKILYAASSELNKKHPYITYVTDDGLVKKTKKDKLIGTTRNINGMNCMTLTNNKVCYIIESNGDILTLGTKNGYYISFKLDDINETGKTSRGVKGINLSEGDIVITASLNNVPEKCAVTKRAGKGKKI